MKKVITYGTYDLIHYGHIRLLERAKELGDYLIVGITSDDFDKARGKINVQQTLSQRIEALKATGIPDEIIVEEYEGQKIDDIKRYDINIFTVGSDWQGHFDYLKEYCDVIYLDRTEGVSSSDIRSETQKIKIGVVGDSFFIINKIITECSFVNGMEVIGLFPLYNQSLKFETDIKVPLYTDYGKLINDVDALYVIVNPENHYTYIKKALLQAKHVICETPVAINQKECKELYSLSKKMNCVLMEGLKTAYSLAYERLKLLIKSGLIGDVVSVDATCTRLKEPKLFDDNGIQQWGSLLGWGPFALLPVFNFLGTDYLSADIQTKLLEGNYDLFTKVNFLYPHSVASIKVGNGVKSEGELVISGTKGYIYVPAPWWKTDYFEVRFENPQDNKRYFYQLEGEGIRYMLVNFLKVIKNDKYDNLGENFSLFISRIFEDFINKKVSIL